MDIFIAGTNNYGVFRSINPITSVGYGNNLPFLYLIKIIQTHSIQ